MLALLDILHVLSNLLLELSRRNSLGNDQYSSKHDMMVFHMGEQTLSFTSSPNFIMRSAIRTYKSPQGARDFFPKLSLVVPDEREASPRQSGYKTTRFAGRGRRIQSNGLHVHTPIQSANPSPDSDCLELCRFLSPNFFSL